jgi:hypothetical protein
MISSAEFLERLRMGEYGGNICTSTNTPMYTGVTSAAAITSDAVIKWQIDTFYSHRADAESTLLFLDSVAAEDKKYFPTTEKVAVNAGTVLLQERIIPASATGDEWVESSENFIRQLITMSFKYGVGDVHYENFGYRASDRETPVIFDLGYTTNVMKMQYHAVINSNGTHAEAMECACDSACIPTSSFEVIANVENRLAFFNTIPYPFR